MSSPLRFYVIPDSNRESPPKNYHPLAITRTYYNPIFIKKMY